MSERLRQIHQHLEPSDPAIDPSRMDGQVVVITGGAQGKFLLSVKRRYILTLMPGIGRAAAILLGQRGAKIAISDLDKEKAEDVVRDIRQFHGEAESFPGNVLDEDFPPRLVESVLKRWGRINCLINNAGTSEMISCRGVADACSGFCHDSAIHKMDEDKFDIIMKIHNYVPFRMTRALSAHWMDPVNRDMPKTVINVSSTSGLHGSMGQINYATAKAGVVGLTKTIASEWGR